jgi:16S rRNA (cytosine967-C5)-methyltransferase
MANARLLAVQLLDKTFLKNGFSNIVLDTALNSSQLSVQDKKFCTALYYGVIERKITLDYIISEYCKQPKKIDATVFNILRLGVYQLLYMDNVPDNAAVDESVKLAVKTGHSKLKGLVNAVLRNFIRDDKKYVFPKNNFEMLSVKYSAPVWLVRKITKEYGENYAKAVLESSVKKPPVTVRLNAVHADENALFENSGGFEFIRDNCIKNCYELKGGGDISLIPAFKKGMFHVQDSASQFCCMALNPQKNDIVIDICSAPGGKAFTIAEIMENTGTVYAFDLYEKRVGLIKQGAKRLGLSNINAQVGDASVFNENIPEADKILCDVPCSGLGVIRRKPEIKYKNPYEFKELSEIQYKILENASQYLKIGGELVYSTCTLNKKENEEVIEKFLKNHSEFTGVNFLENFGEPFNDFKVVLSPEYFNCDGFFISKIKRRG